MSTRRALIVIVCGLLLAGCDPSPEASRVRGGGPGADLGNRGAVVELHPGSSEAYYGTPNLNPRIGSSGSASK
jgi:hypothetical protein